MTDIVGSTEMTVRLGDTAALELVRVHDVLVRRGLALHAGREVKHTGDGIMAAFDEVANAVRAAADIQERFYDYNGEACESLRVRIGVHAGEPVTEHNNLFGATVQMAFRLCSEAEAGGILRVRTCPRTVRPRCGALCRARRPKIEGFSGQDAGLSVGVVELSSGHNCRSFFLVLAHGRRHKGASRD